MRTLRGIVVPNTSSPKWPRTSASTCWLSVMRRSTMVRTTPAMCNLGLSAFLTLSTVLTQRADALERQELGLQRHQHGIDGDQRVQRDQAERRRAVDQDRVPARARIVASAPSASARRCSRRSMIDQLDLGAGERHVGRHHRQARICVARIALVERRQAEQKFVGAGRALGPRDAQTGRGISLRVEIYQQNLLAHGGQRRGEIDGGRGLADAALLVSDREDLWR